MTPEQLTEISSFELLASLSQEVLNELAPFFDEKHFSKGTLILKKGSANQNLYFLKSGIVSIVLEGELISTLNKKGDVFGELSAFIGQPVSANIVADEAVVVYELQVGDLDGVLRENNISQHRALYRVFAAILSRRLLQTNEKVKLYELTQRSLIESQAKIKQMSEKVDDLALAKFNEYSRALDVIYGQIKTLDANVLEPIINKLDMTGANDPSSVELRKVISEVKSIFNSAVSRETQRTQAIIRKKILLVDPDRRQQMIFKLSLAGLNVELLQAYDVETAKAYLQESGFDLVFCDVQLSEELRVEINNCPMGSVVITSSGSIEEYLDKLKAKGFLINLMTSALEDRPFTIMNNRASVSKLLAKDIFGIEKYLAYGTRVYEMKLSDSDMRDRINYHIQEHFRKIGIRLSTLTRIQSALEEMMMNAVYAAPVDTKGKPLFNHLPRTTIVTLSEKESAKVRYGCDGINLLISVEDPFGSLKKDILMAYLESCYSGDAGALNAGKGGAGRGLHMLIQAADLTVFNINPGFKTEVISVFNLDAVLSRREIIPTFHFFFA